MAPIYRATLFKVPEKADQEKLIDIYKSMPQEAKKDGLPYIRSVTAGFAAADQRAQGFTVVALSVFESVEDMKYYDEVDAAHAQLKAFAKSVHQGVVMVYFENEVAVASK